MFPLFIITILIIFPSHASTIKPSQIGPSTLKFHANSNALSSIKNIRFIDLDLNLPGNPQLRKGDEDRANQDGQIRGSSSYPSTQLSDILDETQLKSLKNFDFAVSSKSIKQAIGTYGKRKNIFEAVMKERQKPWTIQSEKSYQQPAALVQTKTKNQKKLRKNQINQSEIQTNLKAQNDHTYQGDDFIEFSSKRTLQQGVLGGYSTEGTLNNTGPSLPPTTNTTSTQPTKSTDSPATTTPQAPTNSTPSTSSPETTPPSAPSTPSTPSASTQVNNTSSKQPVAPQTPSNSSSTSNTNNDGLSVTVLVVAITVPIAIIAIIIIACKVKKATPQPEQADSKGSISQTNVGTTADSSAAETNEGIHRVSENGESRPQSVTS